MKKKDCYINTEKIFEQRRVNDKLRQSMHINEVYKKIPAIEDIEQKMKNNSSEFFQFIESGENNEGRFLEYKKKSLDLQRQRAELLFENNYPIDYLNKQYECADCEDTGFIGTKMCKCYKKVLSEEFLKSSNLDTVYKNQTFKNFDLSFYSDEKNLQGVSEKDKMKTLVDYCRKYVQKFDKQKQNLLFMGTPGSGKSFLSCAIGVELINNGYFVIYTPIQNMISVFEAEKFGKSGHDTDTDTYLDCDLLIIDDLGTEFQTQFSDTVLYNVINTRINSKKPMIISTNLTSDELQGTYHDRLSSRLIYDFSKMAFIEKDIRREKGIRKREKAKLKSNSGE